VRIGGLLQVTPYAPAARPQDVGRGSDGPYVRAFARTAVGSARWLVFLSLTVLARFGITIGSNAIDAPLIALYLFLAVAVLFDAMALSVPRLQLFLLVVATGLASAWINRVGGGAALSLSSFLLLLAIYAPFTLQLRSGFEEPLAAARQFLFFATLVSIAGIMQFFLQFVIHSGWLFDYTDRIPKVLRGTTGFNTVYSTGRFVKSNGFFLREPSEFSFLMGLALIVESALDRRRWRLACFAVGLVFSYSGTGLLSIAIGLLVPFNWQTLLRLVGAGTCAVALYLVAGEVLNLQFLTDRLHEFSSPHTSGYERYIAPTHLVADTFGDSIASGLFGHGPGVIKQYLRSYGSHDPTWAKLLFEYGLCGFLAVSGLCIASLWRSPAPLRWRVVMFCCWLFMGGYLLAAADNALLLCLLGFLPRALSVPLAGRRGRVEETPA
jgi:hypothetical protein